MLTMVGAAMEKVAAKLPPTAMVDAKMMPPNVTMMTVVVEVVMVRETGRRTEWKRNSHLTILRFYDFH